MSNSSLVSYTKVSPNRGNTINGVWKPERTHEIDTITIHCVVGQLSVETIGAIFAQPSRQASSNYGIGADGRIGMYVEEKYRSWCSSNAANDNRAITIECASDLTDPYAINDKVYNALIKLCIDICKRNNIKSLKWRGDKSLVGQIDKQNMTVHRWFDNKSCPGDYIYNRLGQIASEVNAKLKSTPSPKLYRVQTGAYKKRAYADRLFAKIKAAGFDAYMVFVDGLYKIQVGAFSSRPNAEVMVKKLKAAGFEAFITTKSGTAVENSSKKSVEEVAREVIQGLWGNGQTRKTRLKEAGYDYEEVQLKVNELS